MGRARQLHLFATHQDVIHILMCVESTHEITYTECGLFDSSRRRSVTSYELLSGLGVAEHGRSQLERTYLITLDGSPVVVSPVPQRRGGIKYAVDQQANPGSVAFRPGGVYRGDAVVAGMLGTIHDDDVATALLRSFGECIKKNTRTFNHHHVGAEAEALWVDGRRLTHNVLGSTEYDLHRQSVP